MRSKTSKMKNLIYLLMFLSTPCFGQSLHEMMSQDGLKLGGWSRDDVGITRIASYQYCGKDTLCGLPILTFISNNAIPISIYIVEEKVYLIHSNCSMQLLYNFSLEIGDTLPFGNSTVSLDSIYEVELLDGTSRMRYDFYSYGNLRTSWIYGIGSITSGFLPGNAFLGTHFTCASINDVIIWEEESKPFSCDEVLCFDARPSFEIQKKVSTISLINNTVCASEYSHLWNFGDENTSTEINPTHTYEEFGCYEVELAVYNDCSSDTITRNELVDYCSNNAWTGGPSFDIPFVKIIHLSQDIEIAFGANKILKTYDNWDTREEIEIPILEFKNGIRNVRDIKFYDSLRGIMTCRNSNIVFEEAAIIFYTNDGGDTWVPALDAKGYSSPATITISPIGHAWTNVALDSTLISYNFGETWTSKKADSGINPSSVKYFYVDENNLFSLLRRNNFSLIGRSSDLGLNWEFTSFDLPIFDIQFIDNRVAYIHSNFTTVYKTEDAFETIQKIDLPFDVRTSAFSSEAHGWFRSAAGANYYTTDGFETFDASHCQNMEIINISPINDTLASGLLGGIISSNPSVYDYTKVYFSISKLGTGNCEEEIISSTIESSTPEISLYPNPTNNQIRLNNNSSIDFKIEIFSLDGIKRIELQNQNTLDVSNLANGIYFLRFTDQEDNKITVKKFTKL